MKPSHLSTPRTLADCTFDVGYPTSRRPMDREDRIVVVGCMIALVALVVILIAERLA